MLMAMDWGPDKFPFSNDPSSGRKLQRADDLAVRALADRTQTGPSAIPRQPQSRRPITIKSLSYALSGKADRKPLAPDKEFSERVSSLIYQNRVESVVGWNVVVRSARRE
jgi:hypothetical protein